MGKADARSEQLKLSLEDSEFVYIYGCKKHRFRCPKCGRAAIDNFCMVHSDVESVDVTKDANVMQMTREIIWHQHLMDNVKSGVIGMREFWLLTGNYKLLRRS